MDCRRKKYYDSDMIMVPRRYYESDAESLTERPSYNLAITNKNSRIFVLSEAYSGITLDVPWVLGLVCHIHLTHLWVSA